MSRTQGGNNNAYCQDNPVSWFDWSEERRQDPLIDFTAAMIRLRRELPVLRQPAWLSGRPDREHRRDVVWYSVWGIEMSGEEWTNPAVRCIAAILDARFAPPAEDGTRCSVLLAFNATGEDVTFTVPEAVGHAGDWALRVYTAEGLFTNENARRFRAEDKLELLAHSMALLTQPVED